MTHLKLAVLTASLLSLTGLGADEPFLAPPQHTAPPLEEHALTNRAFQGISSMAVAPNGRLWATWYAGVTPGEDQNNYVAVATSGDNGKTWKEVLVVDPDGKGAVRAFDPEIWMAPDNKLRLVWAQSIGHKCTIAGVWMMTANEPNQESAQWQSPQRITDGVMMCKPLVLSTGEWALPASTWKETDFSAKMVVSSDNGKTWKIRGACNIPDKDQTFDEHMIVERKDRSLWLLARTTYGIGESVSTDRGKTWTELKPSSIAHPSARFFISTLASGNLLLVKHGPIDKKTGRSHLTAYISKDDGKSWDGGLLLDERGGVSYPDGQQSADGTIYITYDYNRTSDRNILFATFREEDAAAGKPVSGAVRLRQVISK
ncbi:MAG: sialidase family protein [Kiritimatiellae bacterium]|nr:sialidase family protein [Kiritimatiellia bacterium]